MDKFSLIQTTRYFKKSFTGYLKKRKGLDASKVKLRKLLSDLTTKGYDLTGRINDECIIVRVIK